jgi:hypothetical protein
LHSTAYEDVALHNSSFSVRDAQTASLFAVDRSPRGVTGCARRCRGSWRGWASDATPIRAWPRPGQCRRPRLAATHHHRRASGPPREHPSLGLQWGSSSAFVDDPTI